MALNATAKKRFNGQAPALGDVLNDLHGVSLSVGATSGTPLTNLTTAHGLVDEYGYALAPATAFVETGNIFIVSFDATNVVVASNAATQSGTVRLIPGSVSNYKGPRKAAY